MGRISTLLLRYLFLLLIAFCYIGCGDLFTGLDSKRKNKRDRPSPTQKVTPYTQLRRSIERLKTIAQSGDHRRAKNYYHEEVYPNFIEIPEGTEKRQLREIALYYVIKSEFDNVTTLMEADRYEDAKRFMLDLERELKSVRAELGREFDKRLRSFYTDIVDSLASIDERIEALEREQYMLKAMAYYNTAEYSCARECFKSIIEVGDPTYGLEEVEFARRYCGLCSYQLAHRYYIKKIWNKAVKEYDECIESFYSMQTNHPQKRSYLKLAKRERQLAWNIIREI